MLDLVAVAVAIIWLIVVEYYILFHTGISPDMKRVIGVVLPVTLLLLFPAFKTALLIHQTGYIVYNTTTPVCHYTVTTTAVDNTTTRYVTQTCREMNVTVTEPAYELRPYADVYSFFFLVGVVLTALLYMVWSFQETGRIISRRRW